MEGTTDEALILLLTHQHRMIYTFIPKLNSIDLHLRQ